MNILGLVQLILDKKLWVMFDLSVPCNFWIKVCVMPNFLDSTLADERPSFRETAGIFSYSSTTSRGGVELHTDCSSSFLLWPDSSLLLRLSPNIAALSPTIRCAGRDKSGLLLPGSRRLISFFVGKEP